MKLNSVFRLLGGSYAISKSYFDPLGFGFDQYKRRYQSMKDFERVQVGDRKAWYQRGRQFWKSQNDTLQGVMGGFQAIHEIDVQQSQTIIKMLFKEGQQLKALDVAAGIGRISKNVLAKRFKVSMLEPNPNFREQLQELAQQLGGQLITTAIQETAGLHQYDLIWVQWCLNYVLDDELVQFLKCCKRSIGNKGVIVVKENVADKGFYYDRNDSSITRSAHLFEKVFQRSGLTVVHKQNLNNVPKELELFDIVAWCLK